MVKGAAVYAPLERDDMIYRVPKIHPAISIKLGPVVNGQVKGLIIGQKLQQKPDLFLPDANWPLVAPLKTPGQTIAQPAGRLAKNPDMPGHQSGFFGQLAIHGLNRRFVRVHAALGKLPAATSGPTSANSRTLVTSAMTALRSVARMMSVMSRSTGWTWPFGADAGRTRFMVGLRLLRAIAAPVTGILLAQAGCIMHVRLRIPSGD